MSEKKRKLLFRAILSRDEITQTW